MPDDKHSTPSSELDEFGSFITVAVGAVQLGPELMIIVLALYAVYRLARR
jgi:hypothetical protein